ncbi:hypothetical protein U9M48_039716 [Paspalum notatum var. saurae]|uniref:Uncharacterized protein n=1 Tax=Paspalum notatum var. saurae TaxID=547442 RepID=A0AAQ3UQT5_PASNO
MAAPLPHGCPLSSLHSPHHRNMKTECSYHKEDDPLLRSSIHALKHAMEFVSLLLPLLSMVWRPWRAPLPRRSPTPRQGCSPTTQRVLPSLLVISPGHRHLFALRINLCEQQQKV